VTCEHKWFGIEDGRPLNEEIIHLIKTDRSFPEQKTKQYYIS
jgi:hypothetical protein